MFELAKKTLVVLAAASTFGGAAFTGVTMLNSYVDSRVVSVTNSDSASSEAGQSDAKSLILGGLKKLLK